MSDEQSFLEQYEAQDWPKPSVTVDLVVLTVIDTDLKVLLIQRGGHPEKGKWALPGGFVDVGDGVRDQGEDLEHAAHRELEEETGLARGSCYLEQLYTFGKAYRDPRLRVITVAWYALVPSDLAPRVVAGDDAADARWVSVTEAVDLAFDHDAIVACALERVRNKVDYTPIAFRLVPPLFTQAELRAVYEAIKGETYDARNFSRRFRRMQTDGVIERGPGKRPTRTRPAAVYRYR